MREGSPKQFSTTDPLDSLPEPKPFFRCNLAISHCESIFYPEPGQRHLPKLFRINVLANNTEKMPGARVLDSEAKSLFQNILAVSPFDARIYTDPRRSESGKSVRMNILRTDMQKNVCMDRQ